MSADLPAKGTDRHVGRRALGRDDVVERLRVADQEGVAPHLSGSLGGADLHDVDFTSRHPVPRNEHFHGMYLGVDLRHANLQRTNFRQTDVSNANLRSSDAAGANFSGANLYNTLLGSANLESVDLRGANLFSAELVNANLAGAQVAGARFGETTIAAIDLSVVHGLGDVVHVARSVLGSDTLELTAAGLASQPAPVRDEVFTFMQQSGLHPDLVDAVRHWVGQPIEFYSCFISYSHSDRGFARRLYDRLQGRGIRCWLDEHEMLPGDDIYDSVDKAIRLWDKLVLICSEASLSSWWVDNELAIALEKERELSTAGQSRSTVVVPVDLDGHLFSWTGGKAGLLRQRMAADFQGWERSTQIFDDGADRVVRGLRADGHVRETPPASRLGRK